MVSRSHGPDKLKSGYACYVHHSGARSFAQYNDLAVGSGNYKMLMDYNCCCDTCLYIKADFSEGSDFNDPERNPNVEHCCTCNPKLLIVKWDPDDPEDLCDVYPQKEPIFFDSNYPDGAGPALSVRYQGTIINHPVFIGLSPYSVGPTGNYTIDNSGCRWTMHIATGDSFEDGYATQVEFIDHNEVTCLGVPSFAFSGISGFGGAGGTVTLTNYDSSKVAFAKRNLEDDPIFIQSNINYLGEPESVGRPDYNNIHGTKVFDPPISGLFVPLPDSIIGPPVIGSGFEGYEGQRPTGLLPLDTQCLNVPRYLCVRADRIDDDGGPINEFLRYREYIYDTGFYPIQRAEFHPSHTGIESFTVGNVLAKWIYTPLNYEGSGQLPIAENKKYLFLYETYIQNIPLNSGDGAAAQSGDPRFLFIPIEVDEVNDYDDHVWRGGAFAAHPLIHYPMYSGAPTFFTENEEYYHNPGNDTTRAMYLGGNLTHNKISYGSGENCPCNISAFASYEGIDYTDNRFIKTGRCSCWKYWCSDSCRCIPKHLCLLTSETIREPLSTSLNKQMLTWDGSSCWTAGAGSGEINLCLVSRPDIGYMGEETYNGVCGLELSGPFFGSGTYQYSFEAQKPIACNFLEVTKMFSNTVIESGVSVASMVAQTYPMFDDCNSRTRCEIASPCYLECGSHPEAINLAIRAYSEGSDDEISGPFLPTGIYEWSVSLRYREDFIISEEDPIVYYTLCYYEGYTPCGTGIARVVVHMNGGGSYPLVQFGNLASSNVDLDPPDYKENFESYTESCDPYYFSGIMNPEGGGYCPFWLCPRSCGDGAGRMEVVITEE